MSPKRQVLVFLIFVIGCVLLLSLVFGGGRKNNGAKQTPVKNNFSLLDYIEKDSKVIAITDGRINGDDAHRAVRITVDSNSRRIDIIQGYEGKVIDTRSYDNNPKAYHEFMSALAKTGFGKVKKGNFTTEDGVCASGRRYVFELTENQKSVSRTWTANCAKGSSPASAEAVTSLFRRQITDYDKITTSLTL